MRLERSHRTERFGAVRVNELQRVIELDSASGLADGPADSVQHSNLLVPQEAIRTIERDMAIVVPCMNETRKVLEGVLSGIPHNCLIIVVSNSLRHPVDRYQIEVQTVEEFCRSAERSAITVHQRDPGMAAALQAAGATGLIDGHGLVRAGKGEAMLMGLALTALTGRCYLGYIDADNFAPGAVNEYCKAYAAGLHLAGSPYSMVRVSWHSKPKLRDGKLFFSRRGRTSQLTNQFLNQLVGEYCGFGTEVIATGNSGEHAFSLELGMKLRLAGGFAVEPFEYLDMFEQFGGVMGSSHPDVMERSVAVTQIETRNPHFHDNKGDHHVTDMRLQALNVLYHSPVCLPSVRSDILDFLIGQRILAPGEEPPRERIYAPVGALSLDCLRDQAVVEAHSLRQLGPDPSRQNCAPSAVADITGDRAVA